MDVATRRKQLGIVLPDTLRNLAEYVDSAEQRFLEGKEIFDRAVRDFQKKCGDAGHHFFPEILPNAYKHTFGRLDLYVGERCRCCGLFVPREPGMPWQVCFLCGEPMKEEGTEILGEVEGRVYKCTSCPHKFPRFPQPSILVGR
jgi:hypothetical protein